MPADDFLGPRVGPYSRCLGFRVLGFGFRVLRSP